jgi:hypothetical protein
MPASVSRGLNENTNGLLRQYFPKHTGLSVHTARDLAQVAAERNQRPRRVLVSLWAAAGPGVTCADGPAAHRWSVPPASWFCSIQVIASA